MSSSDDSNTPKSDDTKPRPHSPVISRDAVADPSEVKKSEAKESQGEGDRKSAEERAPRAASSASRVAKSELLDADEADSVVTQQGVAAQDDEDAEVSLVPQETDGDEEQDEERDEERDEGGDDLGVFLEEIFPDGAPPAFSPPVRTPEQSAAPSEAEDQRGKEDDEQGAEEDGERGEDEQQEEPVAFEPNGVDPFHHEPSPRAVFTFDSEEHGELEEEEEDERDSEEEDEAPEPIAAAAGRSEEPIAPLPAVTLSPSASPAAPLQTEGLPLDEHDVERMLTDLGTLAEGAHMHSLSKEIAQERLPMLKGGRITLVVLGEFNHGKSTVINALLGDEVLPMGITPTTAVITHLVHASEPIVTVQPPHHGEPFTIPYEEMERAVKESGEEGKEPEYIEIGYPNQVLRSSLVLVDTPGVNDISRQKVEITYGYLPRADVILYVLDATQVLKKSEVTFIKDRLLKSSSDRILFVLNKIDALSPEDIEEVVEYARERLTAILGDVQLFAFSGRRALEAQRRREELPEAFAAFQRYLTTFLQEQRAFILLDSALSGGLRVSSLMEQNLAIKRQGYRLERADLEQRITAVRAKLNESRRLIAENTELIEARTQGIAATAKHNLRVFTEQFKEQLPLQIDRAEASDVKKFLPTWIQETYKAWLEEEGGALARSLEELAEEIIQITNESLQQTVRSYQEEFGLKGELDLNVDTIAYDVSVFALGAFGVSIFLFANILVGSLLTLATPVLAYFFKEKVETRIKERAREQGAEAIEAASARLEDELLKVIHGYGDRLKEFVEMAGDRLYRQIEEALRQVQTDTEAEGYDREAMLEQIGQSLERVRLIQAELGQGRRALEEWATSQDFS